MQAEKRRRPGHIKDPAQRITPQKPDASRRGSPKDPRQSDLFFLPASLKAGQDAAAFKQQRQQDRQKQQQDRQHRQGMARELLKIIRRQETVPLVFQEQTDDPVPCPEQKDRSQHPKGQLEQKKTH